MTSLSTNDFLASFRRFIGRRGRPATVYSDNGTNVVGADTAFEKLNRETVAKYSQVRQIDWRFNLPISSWWGGWWERLIGMMKVIFCKVLGKACSIARSIILKNQSFIQSQKC